MSSRIKPIALMAILWAAPVQLRAQFTFNIEGHQVQVHSFVSQGLIYSSDNNCLTMTASHGSFGMTDAGFYSATNPGGVEPRTKMMAVRDRLELLGLHGTT